MKDYHSTKYRRGDDSIFGIEMAKEKGSNVVKANIKSGDPFDIADAAGCMITQVYPAMKAEAEAKAGGPVEDKAILETITGIILTRLIDAGCIHEKI